MSSEFCSCIPGYAGGNQASAVVRNAAETARRADRLALLGRYREQRCCGEYKTNASNELVKPTATDRIEDKVERVNALGPRGSNAVLTSGVYIDNLRRETIVASTDPFNPTTRFSAYNRYQPPEPCPTYVANPAVPRAPDAYCYPTRFTGTPRY
jgi:hypothetical protein